MLDCFSRPAGVNLRLLPSLAPPGDGSVSYISVYFTCTCACRLSARSLRCHRIWRRSHKKCRDQTDEVKEWHEPKPVEGSSRYAMLVCRSSRLDG